MKSMTNQQLARATRLRVLMDEYRCWPFAHEHGAKMRDYDEAYNGLAHYLGVAVNDAGEEVAPTEEPPEILRYACVTGDETYSMIELAATLGEGADGVAGNVGNDTLMNPERIVDLDTGADVPFHLVALSEEAFTVLCGLLAPQVNTQGIHASGPAWDELQAKFPADVFWKAARQQGEDFYVEAAGT